MVSHSPKYEGVVLLRISMVARVLRKKGSVAVAPAAASGARVAAPGGCTLVPDRGVVPGLVRDVLDDLPASVGQEDHVHALGDVTFTTLGVPEVVTGGRVLDVVGELVTRRLLEGNKCLF